MPAHAVGRVITESHRSSIEHRRAYLASVCVGGPREMNGNTTAKRVAVGKDVGLVDIAPRDQIIECSLLLVRTRRSINYTDAIVVKNGPMSCLCVCSQATLARRTVASSVALRARGLAGESRS